MSRTEQTYFRWLVHQTHLEEVWQKRYLGLFNEMHHKEFVWLVPHDDNRIADGFELRYEFLNGRHHTFPFGVSFLEVLVALSRRVAFNAGGEPEWWAWKLIENIGLDKVEGIELSPVDRIKINDALDRVIERRYKENGEGGFFPLPSTDEDQRKVEIWYQMSAYILTVVGL
jgi:hypothetical protein